MSTRPTPGNSLFGPADSHPIGTGGDWISAHCDGGARGNPGPAGYGALVQAADGSVLAELSEFLGLRTNNFAEYSGLLGCLQYALDHHHPRLRVVSDSELMVKQIQGKYQVKSPDLKPLYEEARRRIAKLERFEIAHALRHKNKDADRLANEAMDRGMKREAHVGTGRDAARISKQSASPASPPPIPITGLPNRTPAASSQGALERSPHSAFISSDDKTNPVQAKAEPTMLRGFSRDGVVHILGESKLPEGVFVKIIRE